MLLAAIVAALIFLIVAITAIGKMHDAQTHLNFYKDAGEDFYDDVSEIINDSSLADDEKVRKIWEIL